LAVAAVDYYLFLSHIFSSDILSLFVKEYTSLNLMCKKIGERIKVVVQILTFRRSRNISKLVYISQYIIIFAQILEKILEYIIKLAGILVDVYNDFISYYKLRVDQLVVINNIFRHNSIFQ